MSDTKTIADLVGRCLAAEQRAEAAEAERDRMGERMRALSFPLTMWAGWARDGLMRSERSGPDEALLTAIDAYRAGQPAENDDEADKDKAGADDKEQP